MSKWYIVSVEMRKEIAVEVPDDSEVSQQAALDIAVDECWPNDVAEAFIADESDRDPFGLADEYIRMESE